MTTRMNITIENSNQCWNNIINLLRLREITMMSGSNDVGESSWSFLVKGKGVGRIMRRLGFEIVGPRLGFQEWVLEF